ncbi:nitrite reductase small subunit NirD [Agromyces seonyuensis]|uniref:Nitrite reductase small subunit NirD n=1 Tax=Agromyces seonyuensis TaxID=2662446 RepID=A0A6I4NVL4_9MICO|nr:nitrite reductase small subunit NirD [Agromyces seonyuensis]MWB98293.1 nitrite reductase small subunit NirD [Agromyces seonyuensis]
MTIAIEAADTDATTTAPFEWRAVCRLDDLEVGWGEAVLLGGLQLALVLAAPDELYAVSHRDPKTGSHVMARGIVGSRGERPTIASPLLKQVYDLGTGECLSEPGLALETYRTRVVDGRVDVEVPAPAAPGADA